MYGALSTDDFQLLEAVNNVDYLHDETRHVGMIKMILNCFLSWYDYIIHVPFLYSWDDKRY